MAAIKTVSFPNQESQVIEGRHCPGILNKPNLAASWTISIETGRAAAEP